MGKNITRILGMCMTIFVIVTGCSKNDDSKPANQQPVVWQQDGQDVMIRNNCRSAVIDPLRSRSNEDECTYLQDETIHRRCNFAERQVLYRQHCIDSTDSTDSVVTAATSGSSSRSLRSHGDVYSATSNNNPDSIHILSRDEEVAAIHNLNLCAPTVQAAQGVVVTPAQQVIINQATVQVTQSTVYQCNDNKIQVNPKNSNEVQLPVKIWTQNGQITQQNIADACVCLVDRQNLEAPLNPSASERSQQIQYCISHTVVQQTAPVLTCTQSSLVQGTGVATGTNCQGSQAAPAPQLPVQPVQPAPQLPVQPVQPAPVVPVPQVPAPQLPVQPVLPAQPQVTDGMCLPMKDYPILNQDQGPSLFSPCTIEMDQTKKDACLAKITSDTQNMVTRINLLKANGTSLQVTRSPLMFLTGAPSTSYAQVVQSDIVAREGGDFTGAANSDVCPLKSINISNRGPGLITINGQDAQMTNSGADFIQGSYLNKNGRVSIDLVNNTTVNVKSEFEYIANGETHTVTANERLQWSMPQPPQQQSSGGTTGGQHKAHHKASQPAPDPAAAPAK